MQEVSARLWRFRRTLRAKTLGEWYALVWVTARRKLADLAGELPPRLSLEEEAGALFDQIPEADAWVEASLARERIVSEADRLWLGEPENEDDAAIGAAALVSCLCDGMAWSDAESIFGLEALGLDALLANDAVLARALFAALCWPNDRLASHVLRPEDPLSEEELDALVRRTSERSPEGWMAEEARAVCLRLRNGLTDDELSRASSELDEGTIADLLERVRQAIPYPGLARRIRESIEGTPGEGALAKEDLWRRIVFEYAIRALPQRQILERADLPAREGGFVLGEERLNNWLSRGRIVRQLARRIEESSR